MRILLLFALLCLGGLASAQDSTSAEVDVNANIEKAKVETKKKKVERIEVTGSRIRRTDFEGPSPVKIIDRKSLEESPYNSAADYLRDLPINSFGSTREESGRQAPGAAGINLRGLGEENTLVLMNGVRLVTNGISGIADINAIPEIALESTDILKDGASALYGSDALAGVVNFKTRKNFTGNEASIKTTFTDGNGGDRTDVSVISGVQGKTTSFTAAAQYRQNEELFARDRAFHRPTIFDLGGGNRTFLGYSGTGPVPRVAAVDTEGNFRPFVIDGTCDGRFGTVQDGSRCRYPFATESSIIPEIEQLSGYLHGDWQPNSRDYFSVTGLVSQVNTKGTFAPSTGRPFTIPQSQLSNVNNGQGIPGIDPTQPVTAQFRTVEAGNRVTEDESLAMSLTTNYKRDFLETWQWNTNVGVSAYRNENIGVNGYINRAEIDRLLAEGALDPFSANRDFSSATFVPTLETTSSNFTLDTGISGEVGELWGNPVSVAAGAIYTNSTFETESDAVSSANLQLGGTSNNGDGSRDIFSVFTELSLPVGQFENQLAFRADNFSDFGSAFSPKFATKWRPTKNFMMRASVGRGFRAPLLQQLHSNSAGYPFIRDAVKCQREEQEGVPGTPACQFQQYLQISAGNEDLDPEETINYGVGFVYEPIRGVSVSVDGWYLDQSNVVGLNSITELTEEAVNTNNPNLPAENGIDIVRTPDGEILEITNPNFNLAERKVTGADLQVSVRMPTKIGIFQVTDEHSMMFRFDQANFPGQELTTQLDQLRFGTPEWRNSLRVSFSPNRNNTFGVTYNSLAGMKNNAEDGRLPSYGELDVAYTARLPWKASLTAGIKNITKELPPFDIAAPGTGPAVELYQSIGRYGFLNYRQTF